MAYTFVNPCFGREPKAKITTLLSLPHLPIDKPRIKKPLIDYSKSHVIIFYQYLNILWKKAMEKATIKEIKKMTKRKQKKKTSWKVVKMMIRFDKTCKLMEKCVRS